jgi:glycosyltransferase involved in cell wall biosynthesis
MKLLIITQVIDTEHPILGFFHRWTEEFAAQCEHVHVICLEAGTHSLPANVTVHSLGKEAGGNKLLYTARFYSLIWKLHHEYDGVFVHMNQEYILLGAPLWKLLRKPFTMWRNHYAGSALTKLAGALCTKVFYTSQASYTATFTNAQAMPIGIDEIVFKPQPVERPAGSLLYVGRISTPKRVMELVQALKGALPSRPELTLTIVGGTPPGDSGAYEATLKAYVAEHDLPVTFAGPTPWGQLPAIYSAHELCINLSPPGMFDKVIGEALACECDIVTTNNDLGYLLGEHVLASASVPQLAAFFGSYQYNQAYVSKCKAEILKQHSLRSLVAKALKYTF